MAAVHLFIDLGVYKTSARYKFAKIWDKILAKILAKNDDRYLHTAKPTLPPPPDPPPAVRHG